MTSPTQVRRSYRAAICRSEKGGSVVLLDERPLLTPLKNPLRVPRRPLAERICAEWNAQGDILEPATMPATGLAFGVIDHVATDRAGVVARIRRYAETDLLSYRADGPADLVALQQARWQPELDWAAQVLGVRLIATSGVIAVTQPGASLAALEGLARDLDDWRLGILMHATVATGSAVLGLGLVLGRTAAAEAHALAELDIAFQNARWGTDALEAQRLGALSATLHVCADVLAALAAEP